MSPFEGTELAKQFECPTYKLQWWPIKQRTISKVIEYFYCGSVRRNTF
jgi:hypothetical protein